MGYSKRQFVTAALEEIGLAEYTFDMAPEQLQSAVRRLDSMMADWNGRGIRLGYPIPGSPEDSELETPSNVPDSANECIITNLAVRLAPQYGKQVSMQTMAAASMAFQNLAAKTVEDIEMQCPSTMPIGAGNKSLGNRARFMPPPSDPVMAGGDGPITY